MGLAGEPVNPTKTHAEREESKKIVVEGGEEFDSFKSHSISSAISKFRGLPFLSNAPIVPYSYG